MQINLCADGDRSNMGGGGGGGGGKRERKWIIIRELVDSPWRFPYITLLTFSSYFVSVSRYRDHSQTPKKAYKCSVRVVACMFSYVWQPRHVRSIPT